MASLRTRVLVVADESRAESVTKSIERADRGAEVFRARADEVVAAADRLRPDVVLISAGGRALQELRAHDPELPIVAIVAPGENVDGATEVVSTVELASERLASCMRRAVERCDSERRLRAEKQTAERASARKSEFLSSMSHEIRTPLNTILGMAELLGETKLDERQRGYVQTLQRAGDHVLALIEDVLDIARIEAGSITIDEVGFDLYEVAESAVDIVRVQARRKKLDIGWSVGLDVAREFRGDPRRLRQVLVNLLGNAVKFTDAGRVWLSIAHPKDAPANPRVTPLHFSVTDTGIGIAADKLDTIFDGFVQADRSIERRFGGYGLGLAIAERIAQRLNGRIWVESELGKGSTFHVVIPLATEHGAIAPSFSSTAQGGMLTLEGAAGERLRVLVVDDSEDNRVLLGEFLRGAGVDVEFAGDGPSALEKATSATFDVVLMDLQMPQLDGYATTRQLLRGAHDAGRRPPPVIALSAHVLAESFARSLEAGCAMQLTKPIRKRTLLDALARTTGARVVEHKKATRGSPREEILPLLPRFFANRRNDVLVIRDALQRSDLKTIATLAHNMRGTGASYGFPELSALGDLLQEAGKREDTSTIGRLVVDLEKLLDELEASVAEMAARKKPPAPRTPESRDGAVPRH